jgi:RNA-directed DNA polymerase
LLDPIDHFIKEELRVPGYVRYANDLVFFGDDKAQLWHWRDAVAEHLATARLRMHGNKTQVRPCRCGLKFLGFVVRRESLRLQQRSLARFNRRLRRLRCLWRQGMTTPAAVRASVNTADDYSAASSACATKGPR